MDEVYVIRYEITNPDGSITVRMFDVQEPSLEYVEIKTLGGMIEVFTN